mmetsp:Transcript_27696/g.50354  ORF Transcript_27696/g.50354 Transcript_27696/m.50354 type:complete len:252 (-) Transcript_27696:6-761(-)
MIVLQPFVLVLQVLFYLPLLHHIIALRVNRQSFLIQALLELEIALALALLSKFQNMLQRVDVYGHRLLFLFLLNVVSNVSTHGLPLLLNILHSLLSTLLEIFPESSEVSVGLFVSQLLMKISFVFFTFIIHHPQELLNNSDVKHWRYQLFQFSRCVLQCVSNKLASAASLLDLIPVLQPPLLLLLERSFSLISRFGIWSTHELVPESLAVDVSLACCHAARVRHATLLLWRQEVLPPALAKILANGLWCAP